ERIIIANRQRNLYRKTNSDLLVEGGALQVLQRILSRKDVEKPAYNAVLACALNAVNSLFLHLPNRMKAHELGLLETLAEVYAGVLRNTERSASRDLRGVSI